MVVVKPLEWGEPYRHGEYVSVDARSVVGSYSIFQLRPDLMATWCYYGREQGVVDTLDAAKAAAQADYETRIRSALAAPVPNGGPEGWKLLPIEPTVGMFTALLASWPNNGESNRFRALWSIGSFREDYQAMLVASPVATPEGLSGGDPTSSGEPGETNQP